MAEADPVPQIPAAEVPPGAYLLDVREYEEWDAGHAPGAVHIPLGELGAAKVFTVSPDWASSCRA